MNETKTSEDMAQDILLAAARGGLDVDALVETAKALRGHMPNGPVLALRDARESLRKLSRIRAVFTTAVQRLLEESR